MKKFLSILILLFGSSCFAGEVHIPEYYGYPPNRPPRPVPVPQCRTYLIRNDVYRVFTHYDVWGHFMYREEVYWYSYYTRETRCSSPRRECCE